MKMCFVQDESSHWYAIPIELREEFQDWAEKDEDWDRFDEYRLDMHISRYCFENLELLDNTLV